MPAASHQGLLHAAFIVSTDSSLQGDDDKEDRSLLYAFPDGVSAGNAGGHINSFKSVSLAVRGVLDSICGEKSKLVHLEQEGSRLLLASVHLESVMLVVVFRSLVPPAAATRLALGLAESLVLLLGPCTAWGLGGGRDASSPAALRRQAETLATLDRVFGGLLSQVAGPGWGTSLAPWTSFESSCLHLPLPPRLQQRLAALAADHAAQHRKAPFSFFRKNSCLMYRGLLLASDLHPPHARQIWTLLWALGVLQPRHSGGLPCQILTRIIHLPLPAAGTTTTT
ncbi:hypothetical protein Agub_g374, partial [Astrephomene gubernaculifera]